MYENQNIQQQPSKSHTVQFVSYWNKIPLKIQYLALHKPQLPIKYNITKSEILTMTTIIGIFRVYTKNDFCSSVECQMASNLAW